MLALRELQFAVADAVIHPVGAGGALALVTRNRLSPQVRLAVYRNNFHENLRHTLALTFPVIVKLLGEHCFHRVATLHLRGYPSASGNLVDYGDGFPHWLTRVPQLAGLPYLHDVAKLEWSIHQVLQAPATAPMDPAEFSLVSPAEWPSLQLRPTPACRLLASEFPILRIWQSNQDGHPDSAVALDAGGCQLLMLQRGDGVDLVELDAAEFRWLDALTHGRTLLQASAAASPDYDPAAALMRFFRLGVFVAWAHPSTLTS